MAGKALDDKQSTDVLTCRLATVLLISRLHKLFEFYSDPIFLIKSACFYFLIFFFFTPSTRQELLLENDTGFIKIWLKTSKLLFLKNPHCERFYNRAGGDWSGAFNILN